MIILIFLCNMYRLFSYPSFPNFQISSSLPTTKLMIGVITNTNYSTVRSESILKSWGPDFLSSPYSGELVFCARDPKPKEDLQKIVSIPIHQNITEFWDSIPTPFIGNWAESWISRNFIVILRTTAIINYFTLESKSNWLVRLVDDCYVNMIKLHLLINYLDTTYNSNSDIAVLGNCVEVEVPFLQGGSGFLMSRRAAYLFTAYSYEWLRTMSTLEDWHFTNFLSKIGWSMWNASSPFFLGHLFKVTQDQVTTNYFYPGQSYLQNCTFTAYTFPFCRPFYAPMQNVVFFHDPDHKLNHLEMEHFLHVFAKNVYFSQRIQNADVCYSKKMETIYV